MQKIIIKIEDEKLPVPEAECYIISADIKRCEDKIYLTESVELCNKLNLDGVIIDLSKSENIKKDYAEIKSQLKDKIIGIISRNRRHEAMLISEQEPDFIAFRAWQDGFDKVQELVSWYNEFFLIQSAVIIEDDVDYKIFQSDMVILKQR